ncbi:MAG TPA: oxygen-independent coproporphyrinogen III oxidase [Burkholderiales bacterium]|nr:oxygen-independent coproporphyrinogen III oxidase [Burkholderiales bacterium]
MTITAREHPGLDVDLDLIARLDRNGPRYTSYPTADRFVEGFDADAYAAWARRRNTSGAHRPLSLYVHLPFCRSLCYYCGCNKVITQDVSKSQRYLAALKKEIAMQAGLFRDDLCVTQMHWGGGTPTFYTLDELADLFATLRRHFDLSPEGDYSIEIDPRTASPDTIAALGELGFNRVSFGVQDFDPDVQRAINRVQSEEQTRGVIDAARLSGFRSVNVDLIYGLPKQNLLTFNRTLARVVALKPDRIAVYNYAHLPSRFKSQRLIRSEDIPRPDVKLKLLGLAVQRLAAAGYVYIGMDHFALPDDPLAVAQRQGRLQRNFQGYSTHAECDLIGLGVSSIGAVGPSYSQNARTLTDYYARLDRGELPVARGAALTADDLVRRSVIQTLMCHFELSKEAIECAYLVDFDRYFERELNELASLAREGLLELGDDWITVTPKGRMLIRSVCMPFDKYLRQADAAKRYSRTI